MITLYSPISLQVSRHCCRPLAPQAVSPGSYREHSQHIHVPSMEKRANLFGFRGIYHPLSRTTYVYSRNVQWGVIIVNNWKLVSTTLKHKFDNSRTRQIYQQRNHFSFCANNMRCSDWTQFVHHNVFIFHSIAWEELLTCFSISNFTTGGGQADKIVEFGSGGRDFELHPHTHRRWTSSLGNPQLAADPLLKKRCTH